MGDRYEARPITDTSIVSCWQRLLHIGLNHAGGQGKYYCLDFRLFLKRTFSQTYSVVVPETEHLTQRELLMQGDCVKTECSVLQFLSLSAGDDFDEPRIEQRSESDAKRRCWRRKKRDQGAKLVAEE